MNCSNYQRGGAAALPKNEVIVISRKNADLLLVTKEEKKEILNSNSQTVDVEENRQCMNKTEKSGSNILTDNDSLLIDGDSMSAFDTLSELDSTTVKPVGDCSKKDYLKVKKEEDDTTGRFTKKFNRSVRTNPSSVEFKSPCHRKSMTKKAGGSVKLTPSLSRNNWPNLRRSVRSPVIMYKKAISVTKLINTPIVLKRERSVLLKNSISSASGTIQMKSETKHNLKSTISHKHTSNKQVNDRSTVSFYEKTKTSGCKVRLSKNKQAYQQRQVKSPISIRQDKPGNSGVVKPASSFSNKIWNRLKSRSSSSPSPLKKNRSKEKNDDQLSKFNKKPMKRKSGKMPDFSKLHERTFGKMDSLDSYLDRKNKRTEELLNTKSAKS